MRLSFFISCCLAAVTWASTPRLRVHDDTFVPDAVLRVTEQNINLGCIDRQSVVINGTSPGPELRFVSGSVVWIRVYNDMTDANLTMHWHGLTMAAAPFADGSPAASQWAIGPLLFFDYELNLGDIGPGTYFCHSHVGFQAITATAALIITDRPGTIPAYAYDGEHNVIFTDLYNVTDAEIEQGLVASPFKWTGEVGAVLVNGYGVSTYPHTNNASNCRFASIAVEPGKVYRLRFIGATGLSFLSVGFEAHNLSLIEADGAYTQPVEIPFLQIGGGQRYSALLRTLTCAELAQQAGGRRQFYMQAETRDRPLNATAYAILDYGNTCDTGSSYAPKAVSATSPPSTPPLVLPPTVQGWLDYELFPLTPGDDFPSAADVTRRVIVNTYQLAINGFVRWSESGMSWTEATPSVPYLVALYENATQYLPDYAYALAHGGIDSRVTAFPALIGEVLEIVIENTGSYSAGTDVHPMHFHGAHFYYLGSGRGEYDSAANEQRLAGRTPVKRDTTMLYRYSANETPMEPHSWIAWRINVTQPGVWMLHCHTLQHMIMGMQAAWVFGNHSEIVTLPLPMVEGYLKFGGNVYGDDDHPPSVIHFFDPDDDDDEATTEGQ